MKKKLSFIVPVYNEQENLFVLYEKLIVLCDQLFLKYDSEIVLINDGSSDASWSLIRQFVKQDERIRGVSFTRNFGHQIALTAGYDYATGDAVISLDADLQHPPEYIISMIEAWEKGFPIVYARRRTTNEGFFKHLSSIVYVKLLSLVAGQSFPQGVADFRLLDKAVVKELRGCSERFRYVRGAIAILGFPYTCIDYDQPLRERGVSKYTLFKMLALGFNGLVCFSTLPLRALCYLGFVMLACGGIAMIWALYNLWLQGHSLLWLGSMLFSLYVLVGVIFLMLWMISEYAIRMYESLKRKDPYTVYQRVGKKVCRKSKHLLYVAAKKGEKYESFKR